MMFRSAVGGGKDDSILKLSNPDEILITVDVDWAPDELIDDTIRLLRECSLEATIFATHQTEFLASLTVAEDVEVGLHPNFVSMSEVEKTLVDLLLEFPSAVSVRSHGLLSSSRLQKLYLDHSLNCCLDIFLRHCPGITPFWRWGAGGLLMLPYFWEDGNAIRDDEEKILDLRLLTTLPGLKIFNFHPIHLYTNNDSSDYYHGTLRDFYHDPKKLKSLRRKRGVRDILELLAELVHERQSGSRTIAKLYSEIATQIEAA